MISLLVGLIVGVIFSLLKVDLPAPNTLNGVLGIVGLFLGYILVKRFL